MAKGITEIIADFKVLHPEAFKRIRRNAIDEIKANLHEIYSQNLYCMEDMCHTDGGCDCDDCLYTATERMLERVKEGAR